MKRSTFRGLMWAPIPLLVLGIGIGFMIAEWGGSDLTGSAARPGRNAGNLGSEPLGNSPNAFAPAPLSSARGEGERAGELSGRVLDDLHSSPIAALVQLGDGRATWSDPVTGLFRVAGPRSAHASLRVRAQGYREANVDLTARAGAGEVEVRLLPARSAELLAEYEGGTPLVDARIEWGPAPTHSERGESLGWLQSRRPLRGSHGSTRTNAAGRARLELAGPAFVTLFEPENGTASNLELRPGESKRLVLAAPLRLRVLDHASGAPLGGLGLDLWSPTDVHALVDSVVTDGEGWALYRPRRYPILVRRQGAAMWQGALLSNDPNVTLLGPRLPQATLARIEARPAPGEVTLRVHRTSGRVRLVDDDSGEPLAGPARVSRPEKDCGLIGRPTFCSILGTRSSFGSSDGPYALLEGYLDLPILLRFEGEGNEPIPAYRDVAFVAEGYHPVRLSELPNVDLIGGEIPVIRCRRAVQRSVRVTYEDGAPFRGTVAIHSLDPDVFSWSAPGRKDGLHGPFDWYGSALAVDLGQAQRWDLEIPRAALDSADTATLVIPARAGTIVVEGVPALNTTSLVAKPLAASGYTPTALLEGEVHFEHLPPGTYLVGPREWVQGVEPQTFRPSVTGELIELSARLVVGPGVVRRMNWNPNWAGAVAREGTIRVSGSAPIEVILVPRYAPPLPEGETPGPVIPFLSLGRSSPRIPLDAHGRYRIEAGDPVPDRIALCVADPIEEWGSSGGLRVLDAILPGESADIATASLSLVWEGPPGDRSVIVEYDLPTDAYRRALKTVRGGFTTRWWTSAPLRLDAVPLGVREIRVQGQSIPVALRAGQDTALAVDPDRSGSGRGR